MKGIIIFLVILLLGGGFATDVVADSVKEKLDRMSAVLSTSPFGREFYVLNSDSPLYPIARERLKPYPDGQRKLFTSIDNANSACLANRGDTIYLIGGYTNTTLVPGVTFAKDDVSVIGVGPSIPTLGGNGVGAAVTITADNFKMRNVEIVAGRTDNSIALMYIGTGVGTPKNVVLEDMRFIAGTETRSTTDAIIIDSVDSLVMRNCFISNPFGNTYVPASLVEFVGGCTNSRLEKNIITGYVSGAALEDQYASTGLILIDNIVAVSGTTAEAATLDSNPNFLVSVNNKWAGSDTTLANIAELGAQALIFDNRVLEGSHHQDIQATDVEPSIDTD
ncbi:MAG: hypothetical protein GY853_13310 [PVC group bacterium]|nr:hypothetical protein [PVC group bacterium]